MWTPDQTAMRQVFIDSWHKHQQQQPASALEQQIAHIILQHPDMHRPLQQPGAVHDHDAMFLHLSTHLALLEQLNTDRPAGIVRIHHALCQKISDPHHASHLMMQCLLDNLTGMRNNPQQQQHCYMTQLQDLLKHS